MMQTRVEKSQDNKSRAAANAVTSKEGVGQASFQFVDNRAEAVAQRRLQAMTRNSHQVRQLRDFRETKFPPAGGLPVQRQEKTPKKPENSELDLGDSNPEPEIASKDPDERKEEARTELLAAVDKSDVISGEDFEAVLAQLKEKYCLTETEVDLSNPENMKVALYASPVLIIAGIALGIVVIGAGYYIYKRVKYNQIITRLTNAGYNRNQAETLFGLHNNANDLIAWAPIILRQIADGLALNQALITRAQRQMGVAGKIQEIQEGGNATNLQWSQQHLGLTGSAFGSWLLDNTNPEPNTINGNMNCWEVVMFSAYKMGYLTWQVMNNFYTQALNNNVAAQIDNYFFNQIRSGAQRQYNPNNVNSPTPLRGDLVIFQTPTAHTAMAAGSQNAGSPEVFSLWNTPNNNYYLQRVTVAALLNAGAGQPVYFFSPNWA